jgi:predicted ATPase
VASAQILLLTNYRPEYRHEWGQKTYYTQLRLAPLGRDEAEEFLDVLLGTTVGATGRSPLQLKQLILEKTQGTPFFMEEVVQTLTEEGTLVGEHGSYRLMHHAPALHIPITVQGVLAARIDRLAPDEKALLQQLSVVGREFPLGLIRQVIAQPEADLYRLLASLQHKEFLYEQPAFPEPDYIFKHALTQEVAYGTVLQERRKALHERTGQALEALYQSTLDDHYSELAYHYTRSGNTQKAVKYLHLAGQQAVQRSANVEAITHLTTALEFLTSLPDTRERAHEELMLHVTLGVPLQATRGFSSPEVKATYVRARELCQQIGETHQFFPVLFGLRTFHLVRGEMLAARELAEQLLGLSQREQDPALLMEAYRALGGTLFHLGEFDAARAHLEQSLTLYDPQRHRSHVFLYGMEPGVLGHSHAALVLWQLGYPDQALEKSKAACILAQELPSPFSLAIARVYAALLHQFRRERALTQEWAEAGITLAREHGFPMWLGQGTVLQGWALAEQGQVEEGITQIRQGSATYQDIGASIYQSYYLVLLAEAYGKTGQTEEGLAALAEALTLVDKTRERYYEAELYRLKGELLLNDERGMQNDERQTKEEQRETVPIHHSSLIIHRSEEAEACFLKAIAIAQKQQAKSLELRATVSLARLWQSQGKTSEARQMLAEIYGWFTEGFETKDLQEAEALIAELADRVIGPSGH